MSFEAPDARSEEEMRAEREWEERGSTSAVQDLFRWNRLDGEAQLRWINRFLRAERLDIINYIITGSGDRINGIVPGSVAASLVEAGNVTCVERKLDAFRKGEVPERVALALIARGPKGVSAVLADRDRFSGFSQQTFDALHAESPLLLDAIRINLHLFRDLNPGAAEKLRAKGFGKEVDAHPEAFEARSEKTSE